MYNILRNGTLLIQVNTFKDAITVILDHINRELDEHLDRNQIYWKYEKDRWYIDVDYPYPLEHNYVIIKLE